MYLLTQTLRESFNRPGDQISLCQPAELILCCDLQILRARERERAPTGYQGEKGGMKSLVLKLSRQDGRNGNSAPERLQLHFQVPRLTSILTNPFPRSSQFWRKAFCDSPRSDRLHRSLHRGNAFGTSSLLVLVPPNPWALFQTSWVACLLKFLWRSSYWGSPSSTLVSSKPKSSAILLDPGSSAMTLSTLCSFITRGLRGRLRYPACDLH